ncbi:hypothetical protein F5876DRAFT_71935 [Lentinula aff. lateritia]|uniref:Uncharacterized protein n=1 Tax=Lentinula aff. lateritia TaxID=2804960 RepID=A0ACC1UEP4_9AGAR|nr:hypothetical protein F5876DRAFT_71935 [Lentinula aff. lateritia]
MVKAATHSFVGSSCATIHNGDLATDAQAMPNPKPCKPSRKFNRAHVQMVSGRDDNVNLDVIDQPSARPSYNGSRYSQEAEDSGHEDLADEEDKDDEEEDGTDADEDYTKQKSAPKKKKLSTSSAVRQAPVRQASASDSDSDYGSRSKKKKRARPQSDELRISSRGGKIPNYFDDIQDFEKFDEEEEPDTGYYAGPVQQYQEEDEIETVLSHSCDEGCEANPEDVWFDNITVQSISFISFLFHEMHQYGPFMAIVPPSTITAWQAQFGLWAPNINVITYIGTAVAREVIRTYEFGPSNKKIS